MDNVSLLGQNHPGDANSHAPEITSRPKLPETEQAEDKEHREEQEPDFMDCVAAVKDKAGRYRHGQGRDPAHPRPTSGSNFNVTKIDSDAGQHDRQAQREDVPPK